MLFFHYAVTPARLVFSPGVNTFAGASEVGATLVAALPVRLLNRLAFRSPIFPEVGTISVTCGVGGGNAGGVVDFGLGPLNRNIGRCGSI
jgi:hypothetical protein